MYLIVVDTNVIISSLWGGNPGELVDLWNRGNIRLLSSQEIIEEYMLVLARFGSAKSDLKKWAEKFMGSTEKVVTEIKIDVIKADPSDNRFLECAVEGKADYVVTGDKHLLNLKNFRGIRIVKVSAFLNEYYKRFGR